MGPKFPLNGPALISSFSGALSFILHPFLTHFVLTNLSFSFPATLALIHLSTTAICLWFWSLFGLFRVRLIPLTSLIPLAASAALLALLAIFTLAKTSLLIFQTARLLSASIVLAVHTRAPIPLILALLSSTLLVLPNDVTLLLPICYTAFASTTAICLRTIAAKTNASELQLQVSLRTVASFFLLIPAILLDKYTIPETRIRLSATDDTTTILVFSTGLLSFFSFTASRATINKLSPEMHNWILLIANLFVFACHFITHDDDLYVRQMFGVFGLTASWSFLAEKRRSSVEASHAQDEAGRESI